ncbi:MAG: ArsR family transcriptional regulator [Opitutales bacterium]|nr:ArsR family transcriptional regulator [Opitutales bacterium]
MEAQELFKILGNELRLRLVCLLRDRVLRVGEICEIVQAPMSLVSKELMHLRKEKIVVAQRSGVAIRYSVPKNNDSDLLSAILDVAHGLMPANVYADAARARAHDARAMETAIGGNAKGTEQKKKSPNGRRSRA